MSRNLLVEADRDQVIVDFGQSVKDVILPPSSAELFVRELNRWADVAELNVKAGIIKKVFLNETFEIEKIRSWDGNVNIRFNRHVKRVPIPYTVARQVAREVYLKIEEAKWHFTLDIFLRLVTAPGTFNTGGI